MRVRGLHVGPVALTVAGWSVGLLVTATVVGTPYLVFGYPNARLHLVLDTADAFIALLVSYLVLGRFLRRRRLQDLLLVEGLLCLVVAGLGLRLLFEVFGAQHQSAWEVWWSLAIRLVGTALITASALVGDLRAHRFTRLSVLTPAALLGTTLLLLLFTRHDLPAALDSIPPSSAQGPMITGHAGLIAAQALMGVLFLVASVAFTRQASRTHDSLLRWVGPALALAACARVNYLLFPSLFTDWIYTGDLLRTGAYLLLLVGAAQEIGEYWATRSREAVSEDRRRLARELHDGVIQELGYIRAEAHSLPVGQRADDIIRAADRALDEARAAVDALGSASDEPLSFTLHRAARQVTERYDAHLEVDLDDAVTVTQDQRHALVRITREAISNAIRHGRATRVRLHLVRDSDAARLVVEDDGRGFDANETATRATGYGLQSMRDRARGLPGDFDITSNAGKGTVVTVTW